jgi:hypothetical protein
LRAVGLRFTVYGLGFRVKGFRVQGFDLRFYGQGFKGLGFKGLGLGAEILKGLGPKP